MCQYRHYQFDTLRRAKHSSLMLLYHLHFPNAVNTRPLCSLCNGCMRDVRWHCDTCIDFDICDSCYHEGVEEREGSTMAGEGEVDDDDDNNSRSTANHATGKRGTYILFIAMIFIRALYTPSTHPLNIPSFYFFLSFPNACITSPAAAMTTSSSSQKSAAHTITLTDDHEHGKGKIHPHTLTPWRVTYAHGSENDDDGVRAP